MMNCISESGNWKSGTNTSASAEASSPSCLMSETTPTMCRSPAMGIFTSLPIGSSPLKYHLPDRSFTIVNFTPVSRPSSASNTRPRSKPDSHRLEIIGHDGSVPRARTFERRGRVGPSIVKGRSTAAERAHRQDRNPRRVRRREGPSPVAVKSSGTVASMPVSDTASATARRARRRCPDVDSRDRLP